MNEAMVKVVEIADYREITRFHVARQIGERNLSLNKSRHTFNIRFSFCEHDSPSMRILFLYKYSNDFVKNFIDHICF